MKKHIAIISILLLVVSLAGCTKNDPSINATRLRIKLANASPYIYPPLGVDLAELNVDIRKIEVATVEASDSSETWTTLEIDSSAHNIAPLLIGKSKQISDKYFPMGVLRRIKITFGDNSSFKTHATSASAPVTQKLILGSHLKDGTIFDVDAGMYANYISSIMIEINSTLSIKESNGNYFFNPRVRVFPETFGGALKGVALPKEAAPIVIITQEKDTFLSIPEAVNSMFYFRGLREGKWKVAVLSPNPQSKYIDTVFTSDSVFIGKTIDVKTITMKKKT